MRHYSVRTERTYTHWIARYIRFHGRRHPRDLGADEVTTFLSSLANQGHVAAATQNQALAAILFLYREVLHIELPWLAEVVRAKRPKRLPTVLTSAEVRAVLDRMAGLYESRCASSSTSRAAFTRGIASERSPVSSFHSRTHARIRGPAVPGVGIGSFRRITSPRTHAAESAGAITSTTRPSSAR